MPRKQTKHTGVVLIRPSKTNRMKRWRARFEDPDGGDMRWETLPRHVRNKEQRTQWAVAKCDELSRRREELKRPGAVRATRKPLADVIDQFYDNHPELSDKTIEGLRLGTDRLVTWGARNGVHTADDLTRPKLKRFRAHVVATAKQQSAEGVKQGGKVNAKTRRSPTTINNNLRNTARVLRDLIDDDAFSGLVYDDVRRALKPVKTETKLKPFLQPAEIRRLLEAAQRHDADVFAMTRAEKKANAKKPGTLRHDPIAPFTVFCLLSGCRFSEALDLKWKDVHLDALDGEGRRVGEIRILASKTGHERSLWLEVCPALRQLLIADKLRTGGKGRVFGSVTRAGAIKAMRRMKKSYGAPESSGWQALRRTCSTFLINADGIPMGLFQAARQLGHSAVISERNYAGLIRGIDPNARDLETAMQVQDVCGDIVDSVQTRRAA